MSNTIDITMFKVNDGLAKVGEAKVEEDGVFEGFFFENPALFRLIKEQPESVMLNVALIPSAPSRNSDNLRLVQNLLADEGVYLLLHQIESIIKVLHNGCSSN